MVAVAWEHAPAGVDRPRPPARAGGRAAPAVPCRPGAGVGRRPDRVLRRRRAVAAVAVAVAVGVVGMASGGAPTPLRTHPAAGTTPPATVVVGAGDTLWAVVGPHVPPGSHPMAYAVEVAAYNNLDAQDVPAGTIVRLPPVRP